jgi:hypothetical protein
MPLRSAAVIRTTPATAIKSGVRRGLRLVASGLKKKTAASKT